MTDLLLAREGRERFAWGADLNHDGEARERYIASLRAADAKDYRTLSPFSVSPESVGSA